MSMPEIPPATPEGRLSFPRVPVQPFTSEPLPDLAGIQEAAESAGNGRLADARPILEGPQGFGIDGYDVQSGGSAGWPTDMEPPGDYSTPLIPGPHGG